MDELEKPTGAEGSAEVTFDSAGVPIIKLTGEIDISNAESLRATIERVLDRATPSVVFDLSALDFMDSSGIALLLQIAARSESVHVREPSVMVRRIIEITGLSEILNLD